MSPIATYHQGRDGVREWLFSGGMNRSTPAHQLAEGECQLVQNAYYPRETMIPRTRPGLVQHDAGGEVIDSITALHVYTGGGLTGTSTFLVATGLHTSGTKQGLYYLDGEEEWVAIDTDLGSVARPCLCTFAGYLIVAFDGSNMKVWNGLTGTSPSPARASGTITVTGTPVAGEQMTIGSRVFSFQTVRSQPGEITISAVNNTQASNIKAAIDTDCFEVSASVATNVVTVTARETGAWASGDDRGNYTVFTETVTGVAMSGSGFLTGGVNGCQLDTVDSYQAPTPGIITPDKNGRLIAARQTNRDGAFGDRVFFSTPENPWQWTTEEEGGNSEVFDIGYNEGNKVSAVSVHLGEVLIHKTGANREMHRMDISNPDPLAWGAQKRFFSGTTAALNQQCVANVADKHLSLDMNFFRAFQGNDAYDELRSGIDANKVTEYLAETSATTAFIAVNPEELYVVVFPRAGQDCLVYHYGTGRWARWMFAHREDINCAIYSEELSAMLFGCADGHIYRFDPDYATDGSQRFTTTIVGKAIDGGLNMLLLKSATLEYENVLLGSGTIDMYIDLNQSASRIISEVDFPISDGELRVYFATMDVFDADFEVSGSQRFSFAVSRQEVKGNKLSPMIAFDGAAAINNFIGQVASIGRKGEA